MKPYAIVLSLALLAFAHGIFAQRVSTKSFQVEIKPECVGTENSKALKQLEAARDRKNDKEKRMDALRKTIELDPDCAEAHYYYGLELLRTAISNQTSFKQAEDELSACVRLCPDFHFEPYYYLAAIALGRSDYKIAVAYYDKYYALSNASQEPLNEERESEMKLEYELAKFFADAYANPVPFDPQKVAGVSTASDEFLPLIAPDNESMLLTRRFDVAGRPSQGEQYTEKFVKAQRVVNGFAEGEPMPAPFNLNPNYHYGGASLTLDNKEIFLTVCVPTVKGTNNCDIWTSRLEYKPDKYTGELGYHWSEIKNMGTAINTEDGWEAQPSISADGKTLYFSSARADSKGIDIYYSKRNEHGEWGQAVNIGPPINTNYNDKTPFMHSDSRTLYFSSDGSEYQDGHLGFGGFDVFLTRQNDDGTWSKPVNLGHPINTAGDEQAFVISTDGKHVYYSAKGGTTEDGGIDIWEFELYKEARPDKVVFVKGNLKNEEGEPAQNATIELKTMQSKSVSKFEVDADDGAYAGVIVVREEEDVVLNVKADGMAFQSHLIETADEGAPKTNRLEEGGGEVNTFQALDLKVETLREGGVYRIDDIYYNTNSAQISEKSKAVLDEFAQYLAENVGIQIAIHGHTDNVGKAEANLALSTERAFSVKQYLESRGVDGSRIEYKGFGSTVPFASNTTEEGRAQNRRTEFLITKINE